MARAWVLKERFAVFQAYRHPGAAEFAASWYWRATHSRLKPMAGVAKVIRRHLPNFSVSANIDGFGLAPGHAR